jgi:hypothetical protein
MDERVVEEEGCLKGYSEENKKQNKLESGGRNVSLMG